MTLKSSQLDLLQRLFCYAKYSQKKLTITCTTVPFKVAQPKEVAVSAVARRYNVRPVDRLKVGHRVQVRSARSLPSTYKSLCYTLRLYLPLASPVSGSSKRIRAFLRFWWGFLDSPLTRTLFFFIKVEQKNSCAGLLQVSLWVKTFWFLLTGLTRSLIFIYKSIGMCLSCFNQ